MTAKFGATSTTDDVLAGLDLKDKRVLVTGTSSGLGIETARAVVAHGAYVVGMARDLNLKRANGTTANEVNWLADRVGTALPNFARMALLAHNEWLENIAADTSDDAYAVKVIRNKPASVKDAC